MNNIGTAYRRELLSISRDRELEIKLYSDITSCLATWDQSQASIKGYLERRSSVKNLLLILVFKHREKSLFSD